MFSADLGVNQAGTPPPATDPQFNLVTALLHGDGTNGAQNNTFTDSSSNAFTITRTGNVAQGTFSPFSLAEGQWSNYFDGSGDYLSPSSSISLTGTFTFECWFNLSVPQTNWLMLAGQGISSFGQWVGVDASGISFQFGGSSSTVASCTYTFSVGTWYHIAFVRNGTTVSIYVNGVAQTVTNATQSSSVSLQYFGVGYSTSLSFNGYVSNLRIVDGTAIYTTNFTPSATPLTAVSGTSLLTCQSNRFKDNSSNNFTITRNGDTKVTAFSPFLPSAAYDAATNGGSGYFDGSGDYLNNTSSTAISFGTSDFTVEYFLYKTVASGNPYYQHIGPYTLASDTIGFGDAYSNTIYATTLAVGYQTGVQVPLNQWNHIAWVRSSGTLKCYLNGSQIYSTSLSLNVSASDFSLGTWNSSSYYLESAYLSNIRVVKGTAVYTTTFTPPTAPLTAISGTSLLLNCVNAGIYDNSGKNDIETVGNAQISTSVKKYGTGSIAFDGSGDYLQLPVSENYTFGTGDFTIEFWVYLNAQGIYGIFEPRTTTTQTLPTIYTLNGQLFYFVNNANQITGSTLNANQWYHVAVARSGTSTKMFVDGTQVGSTYTDTNNYITSWLRIGAIYDASSPFNGYIDDLRLTKGYARYTSNFTPPTQAFPNQ